ncbi:helix-turn-helix domain-containing protein [Kerstersia similis]|uniref:helix-turn-helix domain-containing protein n=1 Tax=Kerstersia similis TaxID=206505 RepID=UPI0039F0C40F
MKIGEKIRKLRRERGLTQEELALELDTAASTVSRIENDERTPSLDMLTRLANSLQVGIGELFAGAPDTDTAQQVVADNDQALRSYAQGQGQQQEPAAGDDYMELRRWFRNLTPENQRVAVELIKTLVRTQHKG